jgi:hypothetical protein
MNQQLKPVIVDDFSPEEEQIQSFHVVESKAPNSAQSIVMNVLDSFKQDGKMDSNEMSNTKTSG